MPKFDEGDDFDSIVVKPESDKSEKQEPTNTVPTREENVTVEPSVNGEVEKKDDNLNFRVTGLMTLKDFIKGLNKTIKLSYLH